MNVQQAAELTTKNYATVTGTEEAAIDPAIISLLGQLIPQVVQVFMACIQARAAKSAAAKPTGIQKIALNITVRRQIGWQAFRQHGAALTEALLKSTAESSDDDLIALADDVMTNY